MFKISLTDISELEELYEIEKNTNPSPWSKENFYSSFEVGHKSLVCRKDKKIVGFIIFSIVNKECHLLSIAVVTEFQRSGAGSILVESMMKQSKVLGAKKIFLEVRSQNKKAISFYKKFNFETDAIRANYYTGKTPDNAILMSLNIG